MQRGALHSDKFSRTRDVAAEPHDLRRQIFPFEDLARLAGTIPYEIVTGISARIPREPA